MIPCLEILSAKDLVFWDFDGVIKDSVQVKSEAFERLFLPYGVQIAERVRRHHEANGGMSRFEKLPLYLNWAGGGASTDTIREFCRLFSLAVKQAVIAAPWVPGVRDFLLTRHTCQSFVMVTATPREEIEEILAALNLAHCFREVHGAPESKAEAIKGVLDRWRCRPERAVMVGDSGSDLQAARQNHIDFLLRRTELNQAIQAEYFGPTFGDLQNG